MPSAPRFDPVLPDVMLLAAGLGRRMLPLTETRPKPLLEVGGLPLLDRVASAAAAEGLTHFVVNVHHHADQIRAHLEGLARRHPDWRFRLSEEPRLLDTGGGLRHALPLLDTDTVLVMNTDAFWLPGADRPLGRLSARLAAGDADIVLLCAQPHRALGFRRGHDFCRDPLGRLSRDAGQPVIYAGVALLRRDLVAAAPAEPFSLYALFIKALDQRRLWGEILDAQWLHVGDPRALAEADAWLGTKVA